MALAIAFVLSLALFSGFLYLTKREALAGFRFLPRVREALDNELRVVEHTLTHVDASALIFHFVQSVGKRVVHDLAHIALAAVEALHMMLRRFVVRLRAHTPVHKGNPRAFVEYVTGVKKNLRAPKGRGVPVQTEVE